VRACGAPEFCRGPRPPDPIATPFLKKHLSGLLTGQLAIDEDSHAVDHQVRDAAGNGKRIIRI
jgi:hypothetical protein